MIEQKIEEEIRKLPEGWIMLLETTAENSMTVSLTALKMLSERGYSGIIISASRPYSNLLSVYKQSGIETRNFYFVDCISRTFVSSTEKNDHVAYVDNVASLTDLSMAVNNMMEEVPGKKFIFIDSITTMLIHNKPEVFVKFLHSILTKMRVHMITGLLVSLEVEIDKSIKAEITQLCDKVIKLNEL